MKILSLLGHVTGAAVLGLVMYTFISMLVAVSELRRQVHELTREVNDQEWQIDKLERDRERTWSLLGIHQAPGDGGNLFLEKE